MAVLLFASATARGFVLNYVLNDNLDVQRDAIFSQLYPYTKEGILPNNWHYKILGELDCLITDYVANGSFQSLADNVEYLEEDTGNVLIRLTDYNNNYSGNFVYISDSAYDFLDKSKLFGDEIIIANVGINVGTTFRCPHLSYRMSLAPNTIMLRDNLYQEYLYAYFKSTYGQRALQELVTGSAQPKFNKTSLRKLKIAFPNSSEELRRISTTMNSIYSMQTQNNDEVRHLLELQSILLKNLSR